MSICTGEADGSTGVEIRFPRFCSAIFIKRLNRFAAEIRLAEPTDDGNFPEGMSVIAHVPSSGRMTELLFEGSEIRVSKANRPTRKTSFTIILVRHYGCWVCIDSHLPNRLVYKGFRQGFITLGSKISEIRPEAAYGSSRLDFIAEVETGHILVEVKSVTLVADAIGKFPDAPTDRGSRQLQDISRGLEAGLSGLVLFVIQRRDVDYFAPNDETDPDFGMALRHARDLGAGIKAFRCEVSEASIALLDEVPVLL